MMMKMRYFTHHFFNEWMKSSTYMFLIFSGANFLESKLNSNNIIDLLIVLLGCFFVGFVFVFFSKKKEEVENEKY